MENVFTAIAPILFTAAQKVANEAIGMLDGISTDFDDKGVAIGDKVVVPVAPVATIADFVAANVPPEGASATAQNVEVTITQTKKASWVLTGEQQRSLQNAESDKEWLRQMMEQGMRSLRNLAESACWLAGISGASRAYGTAGTNPFATNTDPLTALKRIFIEQGSPQSDLSCVIDTLSGMNLRKMDLYKNFYQSGTADQLRSGDIKPLYGFNIRESAGVGTHTAGSSTTSTVNGATAKLAQSITLATSGSLGILAGDVVSFGTAPFEKYIAQSALAAAGALTLPRPGLMKAVNSGDAVNVDATFTGNIAFERSSIVGAIRPPIMPDNPTITQMLVKDPRTGLTFLLLQIAQYGQVSWELHLAYGFKVVQPAFVVVLEG